MADVVQFPDKLRPLFQPYRYKILWGGRGGAKSWGVARALLILGAQRPIRWLCCREFQNSIKDSVHWLFEDQVERIGLSSLYDVQAQRILGRNGTEFGFEGLHHNATNLKSWEGADGAWVEEAQVVSASSWNILIPTIRKDKANIHGTPSFSEIWVTMNPEFEDDPTYKRFIAKPPKSAVLININWRDNPWFPKVLDDERRELLERDPDAYDHVWEGHCRQWREGAIYSTELRKLFLENRVCKVPHDPNIPVYTAWDLGSTDDTAIWWYQVVAGEIHVLESYASNHGSPSEYASQILGREVQIDLIGDAVVAKLGPMRPDLDYRRAYRYGKHFLPHDARAKTLAARGKSIIEQMASALSLDMMAIVPDIGIEDGIQAARSMFHRVWFDKDGCDDGIKALRRYQRKLNEDTGAFSRQPLHNFASHYADAFRMLAVSWQHEIKSDPKPTTAEIFKKLSQPEGRTLEQMYAERPRVVARI